MRRLIGGLLLVGVGCCCASAPRAIETPKDVVRGGASLMISAPRKVALRAPWEIEVMLLGKPAAYRDSLYALMVTSTQGQGKVTIAPAVQRFYVLTMTPFHPGFYPGEGVEVFHITVHRIRGFNVMGEMIVGPVWLQDAAVVRYTRLLEASLEARH